MIRFVIPGRLARAARPGYAPGGKPVDKALVDAWIADAEKVGVRSIICLLAGEHLKLYTELGTDLPSYYRRRGFAVTHIPAIDHRSPPLDTETLERIVQAYDLLPKPVLVHCSAGVDRTGMAIEQLRTHVENSRRSASFGTHGGTGE